jgi:tetratricopeptide (TPR) repeat protein/transcriptional regulator with XRE-family HTH domain
MDTVPSVAFGTLLRRYRVAVGLTQEELAERSGISRRSLGDMERGVAHIPRKDTVALLAAALALAPQDRSVFADAAQRLGAAPAPVPAPAVTTAPPFVGRTRELALLQRHLAGAGPPVLLLAGEPGIGKTRLLRAAIPRAVAQGLRVLEGGCQRRGGQEPYAPLLGALQRHIRSRRLVQRRAELQGCAWLVRLLPELVSGPIEPLPAWTLAPEQEQRLMFEAVVRFLTNVAGSAGTLLVLDDLQWAGRDALDLLATLARSAAEVPLRVLGAYRDTEVQSQDPLSVMLADLAHAGQAARRLLGPLAPPEAQELLDGLLAGVADDMSALRERVLQRTGGVPFFLVSYAQAVHADTAGREGAPGSGEAAIPWDVAQTIRQRVAALPEPAREILGVAAVADRVAESALLTATTPHPNGEVLAALNLATQVGLLQEEAQVYRFAHDVIREVVEADLGLARRLALHKRVAEALEGRPGEPPLDRLAYHYARGDVLDKAALYLERAGDRARAQFAHTAAEGYYREAVDHLERLGHRRDAARVREKRGTVLRLAGRYEAALVELDQAVATYRAAGDLESVARALAETWVAHAERGTVEEGIICFQSALHLLEDNEPSYGLAALYSALVMLLSISGRVPELVAAVGRMVELARAVGDGELVAEAEAKRSFVLLDLVGGSEEALGALDEARRLGEAAGGMANLAGWFNVTAGAYLERGEFGLSQAYRVRGLAIAERQGDILRTMFLTLTRGETAFYTGHWDQAAADFRWVEGLSQQLEASRPYVGALLGLGAVHLCRGEHDVAARYLEEGQARAARSNNSDSLRRAVCLLAEREVLEGRPDLAGARLARQLDRPGVEETGVNPLLVCLAWATLERGDGAAADHVVRQAIRRIRCDNLRLTLVQALRVQAMVALWQERWAEAEAALEEGLALARAMPYPYAEARLLHVYADLQARKGAPEPAQERLQEARAIFERLGARRDAARTEQTLDTLRDAPAGPVSEPVRPPRPKRQRVVAAAPAGARPSQPERQAWALEHLRTAGPLSPRAYATALAVSVDTALLDLRGLVDRGLVRAEGATKDRRYVLAGSDKP